MAAIVNDRDVLLQAAAVRVVPVPIPIDQVEGLTEQLTTINNNITTQGTEITSVLNNTKDLTIVASRTVFPGATGTITLTALLKNGLTGTVAWSVTAGVGTLTPSGNTCTISGSTVTGNSVTVRARVSSGGRDYDSFVTLTKLGVLSEQSVVNLTNQVTGQLASGNITGLGALALLNTVNLNTQTTGALNGQTQVTNLGALAYANAIAANQIGAGTLAAGVIYAGTINADKINSGSFSGKTFTGGTFSGSDIQTNTGTIGGVRINANGLNTGGFGGYAWPAPGQSGFHLGPFGLLLGNANDGNYLQLTREGNLYAPGFKIENGSAQFSGSLTANGIVDTSHLAYNAVSSSDGNSAPGILYTSRDYDQTSNSLTLYYKQPAKVLVLVSYFSNTDWALVDLTVDGGVVRESNIGKAWSTTTVLVTVDVSAGYHTFSAVLKRLTNANGDYISKRTLSVIGLMR